jgi:hypothetical protein
MTARKSASRRQGSGPLYNRKKWVFRALGLRVKSVESKILNPKTLNPAVSFDC